MNLLALIQKLIALRQAKQNAFQAPGVAPSQTGQHLMRALSAQRSASPSPSPGGINSAIPGLAQQGLGIAGGAAAGIGASPIAQKFMFNTVFPSLGFGMPGNGPTSLSNNYLGYGPNTPFVMGSNGIYYDSKTGQPFGQGTTTYSLQPGQQNNPTAQANLQLAQTGTNPLLQALSGKTTNYGATWTDMNGVVHTSSGTAPTGSVINA